jgi:hypothetical protein
MNAAVMPGSSKDAHELVPSLSDGMAIKIDEMSNPIPIAMVSLACMAHLPSRYSPPRCIGAVKTPIKGNPDPALVNTSAFDAVDGSSTGTRVP